MVTQPWEITPSLEDLMHQAVRALEEAGLTTQDLLDEIPVVGNELMRKEYGDAFVDELERLHKAGTCE
ncbi:MAG TPA: hypothetical protein VNL35_18220 [Chloroflexota bacterium]|nr:hypothetical protein [Chloroflexota bacterium]